MKTRLFYLDAIKAIAILFMITIHIPLYCNLKYNFWGTIASVFCMPLFFTISGYCTNVENFEFKKRLRLLIPFFIFGILFTLYANESISSFFTTMDKNGYWFLLLIVAFNFFIYIIKILKLNLHVGFILFEALFLCLYLISPKSIRYALSINLCIMYWPFIYFGLLLRRKQIFNVLIKQKTLPLFCFIAFSIIYVLSIKLHCSILNFFSYCYSISIIIFLMMLGVNIWHSRDAQNELENIISIIGRNTLQIYVLHFFTFKLLNLPILKEYLANHNTGIDNFILTPIIAIIIAFICIIIRKILYKIHLGFIFGR